MPIVVLIGTLYALSALARHPRSPYCVRPLGMSRRLLGCLFQVAVVIACSAYSLSAKLSRRRWSARRSATVRLAAKRVGGRSGNAQRLVGRDERSFINVRGGAPRYAFARHPHYEFDTTPTLTRR